MRIPAKSLAGSSTLSELPEGTGLPPNLLVNSGFRFLLGSTTTSALGGSITGVSLSWLIYHFTGSTLDIAYLGGLTYVKAHARTQEQQQGVIDALIFKTEVLWAQLDALYCAYVEPGLIPPGAFRP